MNTNKISNHCQGCFLKQYSSLYECIITEELSIKCPCSKCLIKGICNKSCDPLMNFILEVLHAPYTLTELKESRIFLPIGSTRGVTIRMIERLLKDYDHYELVRVKVRRMQ